MPAFALFSDWRASVVLPTSQPVLMRTLGYRIPDDERGRDASGPYSGGPVELRSMVLFNQSVEPYQVQASGARYGPHRRRSGVWGWLLLAFLLILGFFFVRAFRRFNTEIARLSRQNEELNGRLSAVEQRSQAAAQDAARAAQSAQAAATLRNQAEEARAKSENEAEQAQQRAAAAMRAEAFAEQKAEQYRKQREEELTRLQQVLGQIAETRLTAMGLVMTLGSKSIRFDFDKADIKPQYREILSRIAGVLMGVKGYSSYVYGYADDIGTQEYNLTLSQRRAEAVRDYLIQAGLDPKILTAMGFGKSDPRIPGDSAEARATNRRVEIGLVDATIHLEGSSF